MDQAKTALVAGTVILLAASPLAVNYARYHVGPDSWRRRFDATYRLKPGEIIKHVRPPYIAERAEYYHKDPGLKGQAQSIARPPDYFVFRDDGQKFVQWGYSFSGSRTTLEQVLHHAFRIKTFELEGARELLALRVDGDWVIRGKLMDETAIAPVLDELAATVNKESGRHIRFEKQTIERDIIVARGDYTPIYGETMPVVDIYVTNSKDTGGGTGTGLMPVFLEDLGDRLRVPIINETSAKELPFEWRFHRDSYASSPTNRLSGASAEKLLANLRNQMGLTFTRETRQVEVWVVSEN